MPDSHWNRIHSSRFIPRREAVAVSSPQTNAYTPFLKLTSSQNHSDNPLGVLTMENKTPRELEMGNSHWYRTRDVETACNIFRIYVEFESAQVYLRPRNALAG